MGSSEEADEVSFEKLSRLLKERREDMLKVFMEHDGDVFDTSELREFSGIPDGSTRFHLDKLVGWGLIEELDERVPGTFGSGSDAIQWRLTDRGKAFIDDHILYVEPAGLEELNERIVELEHAVETLETQHEEELQEVRGQVRKQLSSIKSALPSQNGSEAY